MSGAIGSEQTPAALSVFTQKVRYFDDQNQFPSVVATYWRLPHRKADLELRTA